MSKRKKKQKMERQQYVVLYGENFWSFGIVIYKFVNWVLGVCDYRQRRDQGLVGIDQFDSLFVCSTQKSERVLTAKKTKLETENTVFYCTTQNMGEFLVLRWMVVDVVSCNSCVSWEFDELKSTSFCGRWSSTLRLGDISSVYITTSLIDGVFYFLFFGFTCFTHNRFILFFYFKKELYQC